MKKKIVIKKFLLEVPEEIWENWKETVPRSVSLNQALVKLLDKEGSKSGK